MRHRLLVVGEVVVDHAVDPDVGVYNLIVDGPLDHDAG
jgi:hypothetical protein